VQSLPVDIPVLGKDALEANLRVAGLCVRPGRGPVRLLFT